jgi:KDO2-lipid IV(A) lauroyltransferase
VRPADFVNYLVYVVVRILICIVQALRLETGVRAARCLAWLFGDVLGIRAGVVDENLAQAFPDLSPQQRHQLSRRMWEHLFVMVLEIAHAPRKIHETNWRRYVRLTGEDVLVRLLLDDRPTLIVTAHFGNFEVAGFVLGILGFPTFTIARTLDNPYLDRFVNRFRGMTGQKMLPKNGAFEQIVAALQRGEAMTLLADQYAGRKGCWVEFFGRPASAHKAIALLALENEAPVAVACARRLDRPMRFELATTAAADPRQAADELGTVQELTQWYTTRLEEFIRPDPEQYWWLHRRWKDTRRRRRSRRKQAA